MAYDTLKAEIRQYIKTNGANEITGQILQNVLLDMVNAYPSLDGYATQQWVQNQLSDMATMTWVGQQGFVTNSALADYLPLSGGTLTGFIGAGTLDTGSYSLGNTGLSFEYSYNGSPRYAHTIRISSVDSTITFYGREMTVGTVITKSNITSGAFIVDGGTSAQFLKADGSLDSNTYLSSADLSGYATQTWVGNNYLPLSGGVLTGPITAGTLSTGSYSLGNTGLGFSYSSNGSPRYAHQINISSVDNTITFYGRDMTLGTVIETGQITSDKFIVTNGTSSQFLKADGSVDSNTYLTASAISDMATQTWVGQQGFLTSVPSGYATETWVGNNYLPLTGGNLNGNLSIYGTMNIYSSSIEWNDNGDYCRITFDDDGITVTAHGTGYVIANEFIRNGGTSAQFLKADGSVDSNTYLTSSAISDMATQTWVGNNYLPLTGGTINGNISVLYNLYVGTRLTISAEGGTPEDPESFDFWLDNGEINIDNQTVITRTNITANAFIQGSDITKKNILGNVGLSLHDVANAPLFDFTWRDSKDHRKRVGTSAQYWQTVIPEVVSEDKRGVLGLQYDVAALAGVITVAKRVVDHEQRIAELEKENALLKAKLNIN